MNLRRIKKLNRQDRLKRLDSYSKTEKTSTAWIAQIGRRWFIGGVHVSKLLK